MKINNNIKHGGTRGVERTETRVASLTFYNLSANIQLITNIKRKKKQSDMNFLFLKKKIFFIRQAYLNHNFFKLSMKGKMAFFKGKNSLLILNYSFRFL